MPVGFAWHIWLIHCSMPPCITLNAHTLIVRHSILYFWVDNEDRKERLPRYPWLLALSCRGYDPMWHLQIHALCARFSSCEDQKGQVSKGATGESSVSSNNNPQLLDLQQKNGWRMSGQRCDNISHVWLQDYLPHTWRSSDLCANWSDRAVDLWIWCTRPMVYL